MTGWLLPIALGLIIGELMRLNYRAMQIRDELASIREELQVQRFKEAGS
jgi:hypothetical protein